MKRQNLTPVQIQISQEAVKKAAATFGKQGFAELAEALELATVTVYAWSYNPKAIITEWNARRVHELTSVPLNELRPDLPVEISVCPHCGNDPSEPPRDEAA